MLTLIDASVVAQLHIGWVSMVVAGATAVVGHVLELLLVVCILRIFESLNLFDGRELNTIKIISFLTVKYLLPNSFRLQRIGCCFRFGTRR